MISFTNVLLNLARRGLTLRFDQDGSLFIHDPRPAARGAEADTQAKTPGARRRRSSLPANGIPMPPGPHWRGISWEDVPGHDAHIKKLNFSLLRRGLLSGYKSCIGLEGAALKQELQELSDRNRHNSRTDTARARNQATPPPRPLPP
jgi:hypothetical protein